MAQKQKAQPERSLLDAWLPPPDSGRPVAAIATTFEFNSHLWEFQLLPRFLGMETDALEVLDPFWIEREARMAECYAAVLVDVSSISASATSPYWDQIAVMVRGGIMHSKIALLQWQHCVRLIVGSANLTEAGYRFNHEIFYTLDFKNTSDSHPRSLLETFLAALRRIATYTPPKRAEFAKGPARQRLLDAVENCKSQVARWRYAPKSYAPRAATRLEPVIIEPGGKFGKDDLISQLSNALGHKANRLWIMSPFWDKPDSRKQAAEALTKHLRRKTKARFVCPGEWIKPGFRASVTMPRAVVTALERKLDEWYISPVVTSREADRESARRPLHAKGLFLYDSASHSHVYYAGSSNFTARGIGLIPVNFEAGIALVRRNDVGNDLERLFPGTSNDYNLPAHKVQFASKLDHSEDDEPPDFAWPPFDLLAEYEAARNVLNLSATAPRGGFPPHRVTAHAGGDVAKSVLDHPGGRIVIYPCTCPVPRIPTVVTLEWDEENGGVHRILLPVQVKDKEDLPPPEALRDLSLDDLIEYLSSSRPAWQYFQRRSKGNNNNSPKSSAQDALKLVDTSAFLTTQVKRFGKAVAGLRHRMADYPAVSVDGLRLRFYSPFGPWALLKAICMAGGFGIVNNHGVDLVIAVDESGHGNRIDVATVVFLASELLLSLKWLPFKVVYQGPRLAEAKREWQALLHQVQEIVGKLSQLSGVGPSMTLYTQSVVRVTS